MLPLRVIVHIHSPARKVVVVRTFRVVMLPKPGIMQKDRAISQKRKKPSHALASSASPVTLSCSSAQLEAGLLYNSLRQEWSMHTDGHNLSSGSIAHLTIMPYHNILEQMWRRFPVVQLQLAMRLRYQLLHAVKG